MRTFQPRVRRRFSLRLELEGLEQRLVPTVAYHNGPLLGSVGVEALFYGDQWAYNPTLSQQTGPFAGFLQYLVNSPYMDMLTQAGYGVGRGRFLGGSIYGAGLSGLVDDRQIQYDLQAAIGAGVLQAPDANRLYFVFVEPGVAVTGPFGNSVQNFLGYHSSFGSVYGPVNYAVIPYAGSPNLTVAGLSTFDDMTQIASHELAEGVTDPQGGSGWIDTSFRPAEEIGDIAQLYPNHSTYLGGYNVQALVDQNDRLIFPRTSDLSAAGRSVWATAGQMFTGVVATFSDPDSGAAGGSLAAVITWGDGRWSYGQVVAAGNGFYSVVGSNAYVQPGNYALSVQVVDGDGDSANVNGTAAVAPAGAVGLASAGAGASGELFLVALDHSLWRYAAGSGWAQLGAAGSFQSVSAVTEATGNAVLFAVSTRQELYRLDSRSGWAQLGGAGSIASVSAGTDADGRAEAFVLTTGGALAEFSLRSGWLTIGSAGSVLSVSAAGEDRVVLVTRDHSVLSYSVYGGWQALSGPGFANVVQATTDASGRLVVYAITPGAGLFRYETGLGWGFLGYRAAAVSAGTDLYGRAEAVVVTTGAAVNVFSDTFGWAALAGPGVFQTVQAAAGGAAYAVGADYSVAAFQPGFGWFALGGPGFAR